MSLILMTSGVDYKEKFDADKVLFPGRLSSLVGVSIFRLKNALSLTIKTAFENLKHDNKNCF